MPSAHWASSLLLAAKPIFLRFFESIELISHVDTGNGGASNTKSFCSLLERLAVRLRGEKVEYPLFRRVEPSTAPHMTKLASIYTICGPSINRVETRTAWHQLRDLSEREIILCVEILDHFNSRV